MKKSTVEKIRLKAGMVLGSCVTDNQVNASKRYSDLAEIYTGEKIRKTKKFRAGFNSSVLSRLEKSNLIKPKSQKGK